MIELFQSPSYRILIVHRGNPFNLGISTDHYPTPPPFAGCILWRTDRSKFFDFSFYGFDQFQEEQISQQAHIVEQLTKVGIKAEAHRQKKIKISDETLLYLELQATKIVV
jgi:hypothetical protein